MLASCGCYVDSLSTGISFGAALRAQTTRNLGRRQASGVYGYSVQSLDMHGFDEATVPIEGLRRCY